MLPTLTRDYLEHHQVHGHTRGWYAVCPECQGRRLYYTEDNGLAYCFNCEARFRERTHEHDAEREEAPRDIPAIRALYTHLASFYQDAMTIKARTYLHDRGIDDTAIRQFGIGYCPPTALDAYLQPIALDAGIASRQGVPSLADRVVLPYQSDDGVIDMRGRALDQQQDPRYKSLFGSSTARGADCPFNFHRAYKRAMEAQYIILTEGEIKALVADQFGFPCVALPGMRSWRSGFFAEAHWRVIVVFDSSRDKHAQRDVDAAIARIAQRVPNLFVGVLPLLGCAKQDIDSFLLHKQGGPARFERVVDTALPYREYEQLRAI